MGGRSGGGLSVATVTRPAASVAVEAGDGVHRVAGVVATAAGALVGAVPCLTSGVAGHDAARGGDDGVRATQLVRARQVVCAAAAPAARRHAVDGGVVEVLGGGDFRIFTAALPFPVLVSLGGVGRQVRKFKEVMPEIARRYDRVSAVDLRFSRQIVIQPAVEPRSQEG